MFDDLTVHAAGHCRWHIGLVQSMSATRTKQVMIGHICGQVILNQGFGPRSQDEMTRMSPFVRDTEQRTIKFVNQT